MSNRLIINDKEFRILYSESEILNKVREIADRINVDYQNKCITCIIVLKGAFVFGADLIRFLRPKLTVHFAQASSYEANTKSSGKVRLQLPDIDFTDKDILIIEDIIDTGNTIKAISEKMKNNGVKSIKSVTLFAKPSARKVEINIDYTGFFIENDFIIGYGLDWNESGRELPDVYQEVK